MLSDNKTTTDILKLRIALMLLVLALLPSLVFLIQYSHTKFNEEARAAKIDLAVRQGKLSQRVAMFAIRLTGSRDQAERAQLRHSLLESSALLEAPLMLLPGDDGLTLSGEGSPPTPATNVGPHLKLEAQLRDFVTTARKVAAIPDEALSPDNALLQRLFVAAQTELLPDLDLVVNQYAAESEVQLAQLNRLEYIEFSLTLTLLLSTWFLVFQPMLRRIQQEEQTLRRAHNELAQKVEERTAQLSRNNTLLQQEIAEKERTAVALRQAKEAADVANRAKSEFLAAMSHELRTPLNAIIGFAEILLDKTFGPLNGKQSKYVNNILSSGRHLLHLVNDILDLARVEAGQAVLDLTQFEAATILANVVTSLKPLIDKKQLQVNFDLEPSLSPITADPSKFRQIIYNLMSNAVKFTPKQGQITVTAGVEEVHPANVTADPDSATPLLTAQPASPTARHQTVATTFLCISVTDTGIGLKPADQEYIFGRFEQVDSSYARQQEGTGLGLALTRKLVELHGGRIWVESAGEGEGSTFIILLPLEPPIQAQEAPVMLTLAGDSEPIEIPSPHDNGAEGRPLALVVEDDLQAFELLQHYLTEAGYAVVHTPHGGRVVQIAREIKPKFILLDIVLPDNDGWSVLTALLAELETKDIPVIIISIIDEQDKGYSLGAKAWLIKPVDRKQLIETVDQIVDQCTSKKDPM